MKRGLLQVRHPRILAALKDFPPASAETVSNFSCHAFSSICIHALRQRQINRFFAGKRSRLHVWRQLQGVMLGIATLGRRCAWTTAEIKTAAKIAPLFNNPWPLLWAEPRAAASFDYSWQQKARRLRRPLRSICNTTASPRLHPFAKVFEICRVDLQASKAAAQSAVRSRDSSAAPGLLRR